MIQLSQLGKLNYHIPVISVLDNPPSSPTVFDRYIIGASPTGAWSGKSNQIAEWNGLNWTYTIPKNGDRIFISLISIKAYFDRVEWTDELDYFVKPGSIILTMSSSTPNGWLLCDGSVISRTVYSNLFSLIGVTFGSGNGSTTFNLPDARGCHIRIAGTSGIYNMLNGSPFTGGALGSFSLDKGIGHKHDFEILPSGTGFRINGNSRKHAQFLTEITDFTTTVNTRWGAENKPYTISMNMIMKY